MQTVQTENALPTSEGLRISPDGIILFATRFAWPEHFTTFGKLVYSKYLPNKANRIILLLLYTFKINLPYSHFEMCQVYSQMSKLANERHFTDLFTPKSRIDKKF